MGVFLTWRGGAQKIYLRGEMAGHIRHVGNVGTGFLGEGGVLRQVIVPLLIENENIDLVFFATFGMALKGPPRTSDGYGEHYHRGHVILTNFRFIWMFEKQHRGTAA